MTHTDLFVVERGQLQAVMQEAKLEQLGITESKKVTDLGKMLDAGAVLVGSYQPRGDALQLDLRLVAVEVSSAGSAPIATAMRAAPAPGPRSAMPGSAWPSSRSATWSGTRCSVGATRSARASVTAR